MLCPFLVRTEVQIGPTWSGIDSNLSRSTYLSVNLCYLFLSIIQNNFSAAFDILNKSGDTLTVKELSLLFGKEETADALVMENFLRKIIKDHNDQTEVSFDEFKMLVSKNEEFRGIQTAFEVMSKL